MQIGEANPASTTGDQATLPASFRLGDTDLAVWPDNHTAAPISASLMAIITFADWAVYHPALVEAALKAEKDPNLVVPLYRGLCGVKVRKIPEWSSPAAALIHARALMLAHRTLSRRPVYSDDNWGSIYRAGDHCMPHSHLRSNVSVVYMLDPGDGDPADPVAAKLCFSDPRIEACCPDEPGRVTRLMMPAMTPGTMLIFASDYVHSVNPYHGKRPRITLSWNITLERLPGRPGEGWT
jgi:hypothetical protein